MSFFKTREKNPTKFTLLSLTLLNFLLKINFKINFKNSLKNSYQTHPFCFRDFMFYYFCLRSKN